MSLLKLRFIPILLAFCFISLFIALGIWQLYRANEKQMLVKEFTASVTSPPLKLGAIKDTTAGYKRVAVAGHFDNQHSILLDNKVSQHKIGYQVLTPFIASGEKQAVLINRGWIPRSNNYPNVPKIPDANAHAVEGMVYFPKKNFSLGKVLNDSATWPQVAQSAAIPIIETHLPYKLYPFIVLLSANAPDGFVRDWQPVVSSPHKNLGYAAQWFSFAAVLLIIFVVISIKRKKARSLS